MKKVLVLASLGLLAASFSCGGNSATDEEKGQAGLTYSLVSSSLDFSGITTSVGTDTTIGPEEIPCNDGKITTSGSYTSDDNGGSGTITTAFDSCSLTDDVCNSGEEAILNGTLTTTAEVVASDSTANVTMDIAGTINVTGIFTSACKIALSFSGDFSETPSANDIDFSGTICGVDFADIMDITDAEKTTLCTALLAGGDAGATSL